MGGLWGAFVLLVIGETHCRTPQIDESLSVKILEVYSSYFKNKLIYSFERWTATHEIRPLDHC